MKITLTHIAIFILFLSIVGLAVYTINRPTQIFEQKSPEEAYLNWVSHTEYIAGDSTGQAIISVSDYKGRPLNASCLLSLVYPNNTFVFTDYSMSPSIVVGNYYRIFTVPNTFGVYTEFVNCSIVLNPGQNVTASKSNSIHVNPAFDYLVNISQNITDLKHELINFTIDVNNNFTYTNDLIENLNQSCSANLNYTNQLIINASNNCTANITSFRNEAYTWYIDLINRIYNCCQRWLDELNKLNYGIINIVQRGVTGGGVTQQNKSLIDRIIGGK